MLCLQKELLALYLFSLILVQFLLLKEKSTKKPNLDITGSAEYSDGGRIDSGSETTKGSVV